MRITIFYQPEQKLVNINVSPDCSIDIVKTAIFVETNIPKEDQILTFETKILIDTDTLKSIGVKENGMIYLGRIPPFNKTNPLAGIDMATISANNLQRYILNHKTLFKFVKDNIPKLYDAVVHESSDLLESFLKPIQLEERKKKMMQRQQMQQMANQMRNGGQGFNRGAPVDQFSKEEEQLRAILMRDPMNIEAQKKLEQIIQKRNIQENKLNAYEHKPELFTRVNMLYINTKINSHKLKAFIDTGAQMTIMSKSLAEKCGILRLLDTNFSGIAQGVGTAKILGRIHLVQIQIADKFFQHSLTILDQKSDIDIILGLDFLKGHHVSIDLKDKKFIIGDTKVDFLAEKDIPKQSQTFSSLNLDQKMQMLMNLGFNTQQVKAALQQSKGNVELAAQLLLSSKNK